MFSGPLPRVSSLYAVASTAKYSNGWVSATGVAESLPAANMLHDSERVERLSLVETPPTHLIAQDNLYASAAGDDEIDRIKERATFELIERWSCKNWWDGKIAGAKPSQEAEMSFARWSKIWKRQTDRRCGLAQLVLGPLPPVCVAWSCNEGGLEMCFGTACRKRSSDAAKAALTELHQMEFGLQIIEHRAEHGIKLTRTERIFRARSRRLHLRQLRPILGQHTPPFSCADPCENLSSIFSNQGIEIQYYLVPAVDSSYQVVCVSSPQLNYNRDKLNDRTQKNKWTLYGVG